MIAHLGASRSDRSEAFKDALGIHSSSTTFAKFGKDTAQGPRRVRASVALEEHRGKCRGRCHRDEAWNAPDRVISFLRFAQSSVKDFPIFTGEPVNAET